MTEAPVLDNVVFDRCRALIQLLLTRLLRHQCPECDKKYSGRPYNIMCYSKSRRGRNRRVCARSGIMAVIESEKPKGVECPDGIAGRTGRLW